MFPSSAAYTIPFTVNKRSDRKNISHAQQTFLSSIREEMTGFALDFLPFWGLSQIIFQLFK